MPEVTIKPLCDATHSRTSFRAAIRAVRQAELAAGEPVCES
ncbi:MAG TPA: hypothetical protein VEY87_00555 [Gaiellaceae bacterium]|jgi:CDGSH-type Zn-finger protein|nr:hypothetical protein [Gaiellaceae bacterium]